MCDIPFYSLQQQERIKELERKEREREILRQKKQGLNDLWLSKKAVVTVDDNSDYHDEELLFYQPPKEKQQVSICVTCRTNIGKCLCSLQNRQ